MIKRRQPITVNHLLSYCGSGEEKLQDGRQSNAGVTGQPQSFVIGNTAEKIIINEPQVKGRIWGKNCGK